MSRRSNEAELHFSTQNYRALNAGYFIHLHLAPVHFIAHRPLVSFPLGGLSPADIHLVYPDTLY